MSIASEGVLAEADGATDQARRDRRAIRIWLYVVAAIVFALVVVGGATRLTESGLSITEWKPIHGVVPPLSEAEWQEEFELYQQIPQYQETEPRHGAVGLQDDLLVGVGAPLPRPLRRRRLRAAARLLLDPRAIPAGLKPKLVGILALGGLQGAIGWWMVASGLVLRTDVSQYRLAVHLTTACLIFSATLWVARGLAQHSPDAPPSAKSARAALVILFLALLQIYLGGLVAGLNAGLSFNTWPLMDGAVVPEGLLIMQPVWRNFFENVMTVQFMHRMGAYLLLAVVAMHVFASFRQAPKSTHARRAAVLLALVLVQASIGITTLLLAEGVIPIGWGLMHQAGGLVVLGFAVAHARGLKGPYAIDNRPSGRVRPKVTEGRRAPIENAAGMTP